MGDDRGPVGGDQRHCFIDDYAPQCGDVWCSPHPLAGRD
jgi:hypothetical protein